MIAYICKNCHLHGVGVPNRIFCPNCGKELFVQTHYKGEGADFYDGTYEKVDRRGKEPLNSQLLFCEEAIAAAKKIQEPENDRVFIPETGKLSD